MSEISALDALATTRSIHRYRPAPIPDEDLSKILWLATRAPSGTNRQPYRFLVLRDGARARQAKGLLGDSFRKSWSAKAAGDGWQEGPDVDRNSRRFRSAETMQQFVDRFEEIPVVVLVCMLRDRPSSLYEGASLYPACQNLLLAARALGYGSTITIWHTFCEAELRPLLGIPEHVVIAATMPLGRPEGSHGPLRRLPVGELVYDDAWEASAPWVRDPPNARFSRPRG